MERVLIIGATSGIAREVAKLYAERGAELALVARDTKELEVMDADLRVRGAEDVKWFAFDALDPSSHEKLLEQVLSKYESVDTALIAHGTLPNQKDCADSYQTAEAALKVNFLSAIACVTILANYFEKRGKGKLAVISSVAGDRGRQSNYVYGAAKAGLTTFLAGVRNRLAPAGITVLTVKPGFVDTPMTADLKKGKLFVGPHVVAGDIVNSLDRNRDVIYTPWFWRWIMLVICSVPEFAFKKLKL